MNELTKYNFNDHDVRIIDREGEPWFVAKDVCDVLGYANATDTIAKHCKLATETRTSDSLGRQSKAIIIPESDLYRLVFRSKMPKAEEFTDWVTGEVLPAIRKTGTYSATERQPVRDELVAYNRELEIANSTLSRMVNALLPEGLEGLGYGRANSNGEIRNAIIKPHARKTTSGKPNKTAQEVIDASKQPILPGLNRLFGWIGH